MTTLLAVDPGVRGCGVAYFDGGVLLCARYVRNPYPKGDDMPALVGMGHAVANLFRFQGRPDEVVVELPQVYSGGQSKGDPRDLIALAVVDGAICGALTGNAHRYFPREWKGQVDPEECIRRIQERLSPAERAAVLLPCTSLQHNVWDAIGIGLKKLGRFEPRRVISRGA